MFAVLARMDWASRQGIPKKYITRIRTYMFAVAGWLTPARGSAHMPARVKDLGKSRQGICDSPVKWCCDGAYVGVFCAFDQILLG